MSVFDILEDAWRAEKIAELRADDAKRSGYTDSTYSESWFIDTSTQCPHCGAEEVRRFESLEVGCDVCMEQWSE